MSEYAVRFVLKLLLSCVVGLGIMGWAQLAWPDASVFTPSQAFFVLASMLLWFFIAIIGINSLVGSPRGQT